ncbi:hypothetical protein Ahy_B06g084269 [Arachis hypogaea]|uniref:Protein FAR1-RELATED SEQUENCE n=1 Tax=Arachis hypogaea TaxID=3818 RepID=A0A444YRG6_ARAHY|nr:hypothetical protein Ahy_B06g084269 [Arachis hypogaea]
MDDSTSDCQLNQGKVDYEFESNEVSEPLSVVDDQFVPKVGMTFTTLEDAGKFYRNYAKAADESDSQFKLSCKNLYTHIEECWCLDHSKVVLDHSHPCCPSKAEMLKQHRELSMSIRRTIENNEDASIRPSKTYQSFVATAGEACMPTTIHRWCIWHIMKKIPSKLNGYKGHADIEQEMSQVVWNSHSKDSFDRNWNDFLLNFGLVDNKWLLDICVWVYYAYLYEDRHIWLPIYLDHHFWARMRSTQRSEIMHSFFNKFITRNSSLIQFVKQYDNCLGSREQAERESDAADFHTVIPCATKSSIEAQFQDVYTHQKFREVQVQFKGKANCITRLTNSALGYSVYEVGEQVSSLIFNKFMVTYDSVAADVKYQCLLFESRGILCRHALSVLSFEQVKRRHTHIKSSHDDPLLEPRSKRFDQLVFCSQNICEFASESEELTVILHHAYDNVMAKMESLKAKRKGISSLSHEDANLESVNELQSPQGFEQEDIANATKKKKTKVLSEINLFDATSVVHSNSSQYQGHVMNYQFRVPAAGDNSLGV